MPRLRHARTGSVVNVDDATAAQLGDDYEPIDSAPESPKATKAPRVPRKTATPKPDDK